MVIKEKNGADGKKRGQKAERAISAVPWDFLLKIPGTKKKKAAVIGWPVKHSLSPALHGHWLARYGIAGEYEKIAAAPEAFPALVQSLAEKGFAGVNLTVPHKEAALALADEADEAARIVGAANMLVFDGGKILARNTDMYGFSENLRVYHPFLCGKNALIFGAGGAARAVIHALLQLGMETVYLINRTYERAEELAKMNARVQPVRWQDYPGVMPGVSLLVNSTTQGMSGQESLAVSLETLSGEAVVTDIVYTPLMTPLLEAAKARGNKVVDGLGMLLYQAKPAFSAFFGVEPEVDEALRVAVLKEMGA